MTPTEPAAGLSGEVPARDASAAEWHDWRNECHAFGPEVFGARTSWCDDPITVRAEEVQATEDNPKHAECAHNVAQGLIGALPGLPPGVTRAGGPVPY